jgi:lipopolysaccharide transport system ATP-binding protein
MKDQVLVKVENLSKKFCRSLKRSLWYGARDIAAELTDRRRSEYLRPDEFWALDDISFELRRGEALGIIGPNGAGKTTLLRLLNGLIKPDRGSIQMRGRVQALIALGAGFNPILTGRENVYVNAAVFGISKKQVDKILDEIIAFSEIGEFIDAPVQTYSSGMTVRLGFAVAIHVKPDVLIIDEVLAVGDQRFRRKARNAMAKLLEQNVALIFISHNIHEVIGITQKALWISKGQIEMQGPSSFVGSQYLYHSFHSEFSGQPDAFAYIPKRTGELELTQVSCWIGRKSFEREIVLEDALHPIRLNLRFKARAKIDEKIFYCISLLTQQGEKVGYIMVNDYIVLSVGDEIEKSFGLDISFLHPGQYQIDFRLVTDGGPALEGVQNLIYFEVKPLNQIGVLEQKNGLNYSRMSDNQRGSVLLPITLAEGNRAAVNC